MSDLLEPNTALTVIPAASISTIVGSDTTGILAGIAAKVQAFKPDISSAAGRDEMRSLAYDIAKSKTALIKIGKGLTEDARKLTASVNAECRIVEDRMDELRDRVRAPLTAWENREKDRVAAHEAAIAAIEIFGLFEVSPTASEIRARIEALHGMPGGRDWQEFGQRAQQSFSAVDERLFAMQKAAEKREAEAAELARLRAEQAKRDAEEARRKQVEHERQIAAQAAEKARLEAEAAAQKAIAEQKAEAERMRLAAEIAEANRIEQAARAKREAEAIAQRVEDARIAAENKAAADKAAAVDAEKKRAADAKAAEEAAAQKRAEDQAHRKRINNEALDAIITAGVEREIGILFLTAIVKGEVPHIHIEY